MKTETLLQISLHLASVTPHTPTEPDPFPLTRRRHQRIAPQGHQKDPEPTRPWHPPPEALLADGEEEAVFPLLP